MCPMRRRPKDDPLKTECVFRDGIAMLLDQGQEQRALFASFPAGSIFEVPDGSFKGFPEIWYAQVCLRAENWFDYQVSPVPEIWFEFQIFPLVFFRELSPTKLWACLYFLSAYSIIWPSTCAARAVKQT